MRTLTQGSAVALATAKCQRRASRLGARTLHLKGIPLEMYRLRSSHQSSDVDILVETESLERYRNDLTASGWRVRESSFIARRSTLHSESFMHDEWPCDIDLHWRFPGFLKDADEVFEILWQRRRATNIAQQSIDIPDRLSSILILALHSLRGSAHQARHAQELEYLLLADLTDSERRELGSLALATGCAATLETVLPRMDIHVCPPQHELSSAELRDWRDRVASRSSSGYFWLHAFRRAPLWEKPVVIWRALWPTRRDLLAALPEIQDNVRHRSRGRLARLGRGFRSFPDLVRTSVKREKYTRLWLCNVVARLRR